MKKNGADVISKIKNILHTQPEFTDRKLYVNRGGISNFSKLPKCRKRRRLKRLEKMRNELALKKTYLRTIHSMSSQKTHWR